MQVLVKAPRPKSLPSHCALGSLLARESSPGIGAADLLGTPTGSYDGRSAVYIPIHSPDRPTHPGPYDQLLWPCIRHDTLCADCAENCSIPVSGPSMEKTGFPPESPMVASRNPFRGSAVSPNLESTVPVSCNPAEIAMARLQRKYLALVEYCLEKGVGLPAEFLEVPDYGD
jgi:hypothetical protein